MIETDRSRPRPTSATVPAAPNGESPARSEAPSRHDSAHMRARTPLDRATVRLSVLIPVYNERDTIELIVEQVRATPIAKEIICVDDASSDGTKEVLEALLE